VDSHDLDASSRVAGANINDTSGRGDASEMRWLHVAGKARCLTGIAVGLCFWVAALGQDVKNQPKRQTPRVLQTTLFEESVKSINDDYDRELMQLERRRLDRLARLAAHQNPADAAATYEQLYRLAIAANMFRDAEAAAGTVVTNGSPSLITRALAHLVKIVAEADRGAYDQSLESLHQAIAEKGKASGDRSPRADLSTAEIVGLCDAYYQRLILGAQFDNARKALRMVLDGAGNSVVKEFCSNRLSRLDEIGKPAPAIRGTDLEGKPFDLAAAKGKVVLIVFWASWALPSGAEIDSLQQVAENLKGRGLQIVGINLDTLQDDGQKLETVMPNIRHFLLDHNVTWPTLVNGAGDKDYAKAYGITEIPANALVARDGTIVHIDLVAKNLEPMIARAIGQ
jgi:peroxiredoxin